MSPLLLYTNTNNWNFYIQISAQDTFTTYFCNNYVIINDIYLSPIHL